MQTKEQNNSKTFKMIPFKDGRSFFINTDDINFDEGLMSFYLSNGSEQKWYKNIPFQVDTNNGNDIIVPLDEGGIPMFGLLKEMIFGSYSPEEELVHILKFISTELSVIKEKSANKEDFETLSIFLDNYIN